MNVNITGVNFSIFNTKAQINKKNLSSPSVVTVPQMLKSQPVCDTVSFTSVTSGGEILKKLSVYGIPDMYTGLMLLDPKVLIRMQMKGVFNQPLGKVISTLSYYENTMMPVNSNVFKILKYFSKKNPDVTLSGAFKELYPFHKKQLLRAQQTVFERIIRLACDLPKNLYEEFSVLMNITNKRLLNDPVVLPFSEREFLYKLRRIGDDFLIKNNHVEFRAMKKLISAASHIFNNESRGKKVFGRNIKKKLEIQMQPEILKRNSSNLEKFRQIFEDSPLRNNEDIINLLANTGAKVHGFPSFAHFERKSFIHELKKIVLNLKNEKLASKITEVAHSLPTSADNVSAFIVKFSDANNNKIGTKLMSSGLCSIDHLIAKNNGGPNKLKNFGLCGSEVNALKTNIHFDQWVRMHPETRKNCQKHVDRLIELYKQGYFAKVSKAHKNKKLDMSYIEDFAKTIYDLSPAENRIKLNISKLYE